jgi:hypothetical protein
MARQTISTDELMRHVEESRLRKERIEEPYLAAFRATQKEIEMRQIEDAQEIALDDEAIVRWAKRIARSGREAVRFERYLIRQGFYPKIPKDDPLGVNR